MPCLYKMKIQPSPIHGRGLFAMEDIPKGAVYWAWADVNGSGSSVEGFEALPNKIYTKEDLYTLQDEKRLTKILHGGFYIEGSDVFIELRDGTQFTNHAEDNNSLVVYHQSKDYRKMTFVARRDIMAGEEVTDNYGNYLSTKAQWVDELMNKYLPERKEIQNQVLKTESPAKKEKPRN